MSRSYLIAGVATLAMVGTAMAQSNSTASTSSSGSQSSTNASGNSNGMNMRQQIQSELGKDGFTNVTIAPSSFFIHATNKQGQAVAMVISPDSVTEVTDLGPAGGGQANSSSGMSKNNAPKQQ